jgi:hypothetical protein
LAVGGELRVAGPTRDACQHSRRTHVPDRDDPHRRRTAHRPRRSRRLARRPPLLRPLHRLQRRPNRGARTARPAQLSDRQARAARVLPLARPLRGVGLRAAPLRLDVRQRRRRRPAPAGQLRPRAPADRRTAPPTEWAMTAPQPQRRGSRAPRPRRLMADARVSSRRGHAPWRRRRRSVPRGAASEG